MPSVKTKSGRMRHFPYTKAGEDAAKKMAKKTGGKRAVEARMGDDD